MKINALWHRKHRMPKNASLKDRIHWHLEHKKTCACMPIPDSLLALIEDTSVSK